MSFRDHFSTGADLYAEFRPRYPDRLFQFLASFCDQRQLAWDCATGNGQAANALAPHFNSVIATDGSKQQISQAMRTDRVFFCVALSEQAPLQNETADLITVAQALHWLNHKLFFREVLRVLKPNAMFAAWCYNLLQVEPDIDDLLLNYYTKIVGPYWSPERRLLEAGYRTIPFPFEELTPPLFYMEKLWNLPALTGYLQTWSARNEYMRVHQSDPVDLIRNDLETLWGEPMAEKRIQFPLSLRIGRKQ